MAKVLTRAQRYKRNYGLIKNEYQDTKLAKKAQTWSDEHILNELGIDVKGKRTPKLRKLKTSRQKAYYKRKLSNFFYGKEIGLETQEAKKLAHRKLTRIDSTKEYLSSLTRKYGRREKKSRESLWSTWSEKGKGNMPPAIEQFAAEKNASVIMNDGNALDRFAHYGYTYAYYIYVLGYNDEQTQAAFRQNLNDEYDIMYQQTARAV